MEFAKLLDIQTCSPRLNRTHTHTLTHTLTHTNTHKHTHTHTHTHTKMVISSHFLHLKPNTHTVLFYTHRVILGHFLNHTSTTHTRLSEGLGSGPLAVRSVIWAGLESKACL